MRRSRMSIRTGLPPASRCDRQLGKRFGNNAYAAEELIAELGAAFTCAHLGLSTEPREDHAQYINSWLRVLKADRRAIFTAASKAQQACDWLVQRANGSAHVAEVAA
jgi:antirestriction protein ArdC